MKDIRHPSRKRNRDKKRGQRTPDIKRTRVIRPRITPCCSVCGSSTHNAGHHKRTAVRLGPLRTSANARAMVLQLAKQAYSKREIAARTGTTVRQVAAILAVRKPKTMRHGKVLVWRNTPQGKSFVGTLDWPYNEGAVFKAFGLGSYSIEAYPPNGKTPQRMRTHVISRPSKCALCTCTGTRTDLHPSGCDCAHGPHVNIGGSVAPGLLPHLGGTHCPCKDCSAAANAPAGIGLAAVAWARDNAMANAVVQGTPLQVGHGWAVTVTNPAGQSCCCTFKPGPDMASGWVRDMYERLDRVYLGGSHAKW